MESPHVPERTFTQLDHVRLTRLIALTGGLPPEATRVVEDVLASGELVASPQVPPTVITMYSQVIVQEEGAAPRKLTLCYPEHAEPGTGFISVLSPVGVALLGLHVGQSARWTTPNGQQRSACIVAMLFQPEATGDYIT
jgi:regulator of nucleoside diphosphate kinase